MTVSPIHPPRGCAFVEFASEAMRVLIGQQGIEVPLERAENGRLSLPCREKVVAALREAFDRSGDSRARQKVFCAISARGVSLRRLTVPAASGDELQRVLLLQIEREFPLAPAQLAWTSQVLGSNGPRNGAPRTQHVLVAAVKRELLQEYSEVLEAAGLKATFSVAALSRAALVDAKDGLIADIGAHHSEVLHLEDGQPVSLRTIPYGFSDLTSAAGARGEPLAAGGTAGAATAQRPSRAGLEPLLKLLETSTGTRSCVSGDTGSLATVVQQLNAAGRIKCEPIETISRPGASAATLGLARLVESEGRPPLTFDLKPGGARKDMPPPSRWKWAVAAVVLLFLAAGLRYLEPLRDGPRLAKRIAALREYRDKLPNVDHELAFLQYLKTNQPAYLEAVALMAEAAPPGIRVDSLSLNRHGDLSLRASMRDAQQVTDFRSKLIRSDLFSSVVVEEQTPTPDRQKVNVRISGQWKPFAERSRGTAPKKSEERAKE